MITLNQRRNTGRTWNGTRQRSPSVPTDSLLQASTSGKPSEEAQIYDSNTYINEYIYLGIIEETRERGERKGYLGKITQRNKFSVGDEIEIMRPDGRNTEAAVLAIHTEEGEEMESAPHPKQSLWIELSEEPEMYDLLRIKA